jgi:hypothetical protein
MSTKLTGYRILKSSGGNKCLQCGTRMRKGLPFMVPIKGKRVIHSTVGKSLCCVCLEELHNKAQEMIKESGIENLERYNNRRFLEKL